MPFITREDGEHFVVPSYRDVITAKNGRQLKKEIEALSDSYGEYITLQKKNSTQYEVAFSPDNGYLLGESIWHHFNRPEDLIYCEAIPNTSEAILVIVKSGSVYLDGSFPLDSIVEELVVFLTQQNDFAIYIYGDVPISKEPAEGKFAFEESSVKKFTVLEAPVFPTLALVRIYKLELVSTVLQAHGIGVFPIKQVVMSVLAVAFVYVAYKVLTSEEVKQVQVQVMQITQEDPYALYYKTLASPAPDQQVKEFLKLFVLFTSIPGWTAQEMTYDEGKVTVSVTTKGALVKTLLDWARIKGVSVDIMSKGILLEKDVALADRPTPIGAQSLNDAVASLIDRMHSISPGNVMQVGKETQKGSVKMLPVMIEFKDATPIELDLISDQLHSLPVKVGEMKMSIGSSTVDTSISLQVVGI